MRRSGVRNIVVAPALIVALSLMMGCDNPADAPLCLTPLISGETARANSNNVLSFIVSANVVRADSVVVRFGVGAQLDSTTPAFHVTADSIVAPVLGLLPESGYDARMTAFNSCGETSSSTMSFTTGTLPSDLPHYTVEGSSGGSPGYVVFAVGSYGVAIDNTGRIVWYHRFPVGPGLNFQPQPNGRYTARPPADPGTPGNWIELDALGNLTRKLGCAHDLSPRMHDMIAMLDGSYWVICDETRTVDLSNQGRSANSRVLGANIQHLNPNGAVIFEWSVFDHLPVDFTDLEPADFMGPSINWTHANALDLDQDHNLIVSFRNPSEVVSIDTNSGSVMWRFGGAHSFFHLESGARPFVHQHGVRVIGRGQIQLLDNLGEQLGSRVEVYDIDQWYGSAVMTRSHWAINGVTAQIGGNTQELPGQRTLVSFGNGGGVEEYNSSGKVLWRLIGNPGYIFRAQRIRSLYRPGYGDPR